MQQQKIAYNKLTNCNKYSIFAYRKDLKLM